MKISTRLMLYLILLCLANTAVAQQVVEVWECTTLSSTSKLFIDWNNILVTSKIFEGREEGSIDVAGTTHRTIYRVEGFNRRWDFELADDFTYNYAFIISPDGYGKYFDFRNSETGESASPSMLMTCRQKQ